MPKIWVKFKIPMERKGREGKGREGKVKKGKGKKRKGKERKSIVPYILNIVSKRSHMEHTVLPANYKMPAFPSQAFDTRWHHL